MRDHRPHIPFPLILLLAICGCRDSGDEVLGRIAVDIKLTVDGQSSESGTLVLRPSKDVPCPLVKLEIVNGEGSLSESAGPVPGQWTATFRSDSEGSLTDQLEGSGRSDARDQTGKGNFGAGNKKQKRPAKPLLITVPNENPALLKIDFASQ